MSVMSMPVLDPISHARILQDFPEVCQTAGVQAKYMHESMKEYCEATEVDWVREFRSYEKKGMPGLVLCGIKRPDSRCQAMAAALVRNYIDARVIPMNTLLEDATDAIVPHVLLIPNLYVAASGKAVPSYKVQMLYDILLSRSVQGKSSVVYVENLPGLVAAYGAPFADFLSSFKMVE